MLSGSASRQALSALGLDSCAAQRAGTLSLGNRQRVGLAAALVHTPDVIVLDEPTNGLDPLGVIVLRQLLQEAARDRGASILVSSHHLDEVARMADVITVLHCGRILGTLQPGSMDLERQFFDLVLRSETQSEEKQ